MIDESEFEDMPKAPTHGVYVLPEPPKGEIKTWPVAPSGPVAAYPAYYGKDEPELNKLQFEYTRIKERFLAAKTGDEKMALLADLRKIAPILQKARDDYDMRHLKRRLEKLGGRKTRRRRRPRRHTRKRRRPRYQRRWH